MYQSHVPTITVILTMHAAICGDRSICQEYKFSKSPYLRIFSECSTKIAPRLLEQNVVIHAQ